MSLKKRISAIVVLVAMVVGMMVPAFAAPMTDISGKNYEDAVNKLLSYNIIAGFDNGQFQGESNLTRAQFATFIVKMLGLGEQAGTDTIFKDVVTNDWFSGYVNEAASKGIIVGSDDGKFYPNKNVTYGEALTILMKMLGYAPVVDNKGTWPSNYVSQASSIKLTSGIAVSAGAPATRGNLARLMWNTLTTNPLVESGNYDEDGNPTYKRSEDADNQKLLYTNFNESVELEKVVTEVPLTSVVNDIKKIKFEGLSDNYSVPADVDANSLLGLKVKFVADKNENIKWLKSTTASENVVVDTVKEISKLSGDATKVDKIKFKTLDKVFYAASDMTLIYNGVKVSGVDLTALLAKIADATYVADKADAANITAILDNDSKQIKTAIINQDVLSFDLTYNTEAATAKVQTGMVTEVTADQKIKNEDKTFDDIDAKDLNSKADLKLAKVFVLKNGKVAKLSDIVKGDLLRVTRYSNITYVQAFTPNVQVIKVDSISDITTLASTVISAGSNNYKLSATATYSFNAGKDREALSDLSKLSQFIGVEGTKVHLNAAGKIAYIENSVADSDAIYGFVTETEEVKVDNKMVSKFTFMLPNGTTASYNAKENLTEATFDKQLVAFKLNRNNQIVEIALDKFSTDTTNRIENVTGITPNNTDTDANAAIVVGGSKYLVTNGTVFMNFENAVAVAGDSDIDAEISIVSWDAVKGASLAGEAFENAKVTFENGIAKVVMIVEPTLTSANKYGVVVGTGLTEDGKTIKIDIKGVVHEYVYAEAADSVYAVKGLLVEYSVTDNKADITGISANVKNDTTTGYNVDTQKLGILWTGLAEGSVTGKITDMFADSRVINYKEVSDFKGTETGDKKALYIAEKAEVYNISDTGNVTYGDISMLAAGQYFTYDSEANIILIVKKDSVATKSQLAQ